MHITPFLQLRALPGVITGGSVFPIPPSVANRGDPYVHVSTSTSLMYCGTAATEYGRPLVYEEGWAQWPDVCDVCSTEVCRPENMKADVWSWMFGETCLSGVWFPKSYVDSIQKELGSTTGDRHSSWCTTTFRDMCSAA